VLALILMDWHRLQQPRRRSWSASPSPATAFRKVMPKLPEMDRWYVALVWLGAIGFLADWAGMHFMVGAFLAGASWTATGSRSRSWTRCATTCCW
jgi:hypothetical protein